MSPCSRYFLTRLAHCGSFACGRIANKRIMKCNRFLRKEWFWSAGFWPSSHFSSLRSLLLFVRMSCQESKRTVVDVRVRLGISNRACSHSNALPPSKQRIGGTTK